MSLNSSRMPASFRVSFQALAFSLITIGKMLSSCTSCQPMCEVSAQEAGMAVSAGGRLSISRGSNVEGDAYNLIAEKLVNPFLLIVLDQLSCVSLMVFVEVCVTTEVTSEDS